MAAYSPQEKQYYDQLFTAIDKDDAGVLPGQSALPFLLSSSLSQQALGEIWAIADPDNNGFLTREGWYKAARIIGWLQRGGQSQVEESLASRAGPYPTFKGQPPPPQQAPVSAQTTGQRAPGIVSNPTGLSLPAITPADRTKFTRIFVGCGPSNGLVNGEKARDVFVKSQLSYEKLGQIWNLADTQQRGSLDLPDFIIGMFLIQNCMANPSLNLPSTLPPGLYEQASGGRPPPPALPSSPIARQNTGGAASPIQRQYTGQTPGNPSMGILQPQRTGQSMSGSPAAGLSTPPRSSTLSTKSVYVSPPGSAYSNPATSGFVPGRSMSGLIPPQQAWDVTAAEKATSDGFFAQLDPQGKGVIEGEVAVPFMLQSQLDEGVLASIWDLADIRREGSLTRDEFAVAMHLINAKLAGRELPTALPNSLVPPSLREEFGSGAQEVLAGPGQNSATKDLFDLSFDDDVPSPAAPVAPTKPVPPSRQASVAPAPQPFAAQNFMPPPSRQMSTQLSGQARQITPLPTGQQPHSGFGMSPFGSQPAGDLLGDDSAEPAAQVPDNSAEIGNKRNQLNNTTRSVADLEETRAELESKAKSSAAELEELESKLSAAKVKHEAETKAVSDLRVRVAQQTTQLKQLQTDVITAESDLSAMRSEKDELGQTLLRDKEEVRGLQKRMKEIEDEKTGLKLVLEKLKKEGRQQKGMVSIAKKQVQTAEGSRDSVQAEVKEAERLRDEPESQAEIEAQNSSSGIGGAVGAGVAGLTAGAMAAAGLGTTKGSPSPTRSPPSGPFSPSVLPTAAGVPLPVTPKVLSPAATGASQRSNNPFDRLGRTPLPGPPPAVPTPSAQSNDRDIPSEPVTSPGFGTTALLGAGAAVGAAAGVVAAGASSLFTSAKEAVTGEEHTPKVEDKAVEDVDPFGAPSTGTSGTQQPKLSPEDDSDPFGASTAHRESLEVTPQAAEVETDPFGMPSVNSPAAKGPSPSAFDTDFDSGFGDSFAAPPSVLAINRNDSAAPTTDFDSAFADFDEPQQPTATEAPKESTLSPQAAFGGLSAIPSGIPKSAIPSDLRPDVERTASTQAVPPSSRPESPTIGTPFPEQSGEFTPAAALKELPPVQSTAPYEDPAESSGDDDEGPEDLEAPKSGRGYLGKGKSKAFDQTASPPIETLASQPVGALAPPLPLGLTSTPTIIPPANATSSESAEPSPKLRRSAPPPPTSRGGSVGGPLQAGNGSPGDDFDPFGSHAASSQHPASESSGPASGGFGNLPPGATSADSSSAPKVAGFDDEDDFDFSDLPPANVETNLPGNTAPTHGAGETMHSSSAFDDEFVNFDDDFANPASKPSSDNSNSTNFEMVSPVPHSADVNDGQATARHYDEWAPSGHSNASGAPASGPSTGAVLSFDDAFGGDFEPAPLASSSHITTSGDDPSGGFAPPPGPPPARGGTLNPPSLPERRASGPQNDDLEDVKKLCAMGFSRTLAIDALEANDYDFQKTLNVLLTS